MICAFISTHQNRMEGAVERGDKKTFCPSCAQPQGSIAEEKRRLSPLPWARGYPPSIIALAYTRVSGIALFYVTISLIFFLFLFLFLPPLFTCAFSLAFLFFPYLSLWSYNRFWGIFTFIYHCWLRLLFFWEASFEGTPSRVAYALSIQIYDKTYHVQEADYWLTLLFCLRFLCVFPVSRIYIFLQVDNPCYI